MTRGPRALLAALALWCFVLWSSVDADPVRWRVDADGALAPPISGSSGPRRTESAPALLQRHESSVSNPTDSECGFCALHRPRAVESSTAFGDAPDQNPPQRRGSDTTAGGSAFAFGRMLAWAHPHGYNWQGDGRTGEEAGFGKVGGWGLGPAIRKVNAVGL
jgi:hypothetical protein